MSESLSAMSESMRESMLAKKHRNCLFLFVCDAEYITIDTTPQNDGNDAYHIAIEDMFALYKQWWIDNSPEDAAFSQTLRFANEFSEDLDVLCLLWNRAQLTEVPYMSVMPNALMAEGYGTWVIGMKAA